MNILDKIAGWLMISIFIILLIILCFWCYALDEGLLKDKPLSMITQYSSAGIIERQIETKDYQIKGNQLIIKELHTGDIWILDGDCQISEIKSPKPSDIK